VAVRVTSDALRQIRGGHPWVFDRSLTSAAADGAPGDLAVVFDDRRRFAAIGLYDPGSPIRVRVLHHGAPATIDEGWWLERVQAAVSRRASIAASGRTTGYRLVHGENDGFPGLVVDRYDDTLVVKAYSAAWLPHVRTVADALEQVVEPARIVLRLGRSVRAGAPRLDRVALTGSLPTEPVVFREEGLWFEADVVRGQKTGHFLDQRDNRVRVGRLASAKRVLDVFACTGGFSVHAAAAGAVEVLSVDQSRAALDTARRNMARNRDSALVRTCRHDTVVGDAFEVMAELGRRGRRFDLVVVDPPSFASRQASVPSALHGYGRLTGLAVELVAPGGILVQASCSSRVTSEDLDDTVHRAARGAGRPVDVFDRTGHPLDHPIGFPEGAYLKAIFAAVP
jgi:23S rRNA (cytosine1962-C5)-methyltransferase